MSIFKRTQRKYVKKAYRVRNWREYEAGLRNRGSLTVWISLTAGKLVNWDAPRPRRRKPGRQRKYSNHAIETAVTLGMVFHRCLRCLLLVMCTYPFAKKALTLYLARSEGHERYFGCNLMQCKVLASSHQHLIAEAPERALAILRRSVRSTDFVGLPRTSLVSIRDSSRDYGYTQPERAPGGRAVPGRTLRPQDHTDL